MIHSAFRGIIGALAMSGVRIFAQQLGLVGDDPPERLARKKAKGLIDATLGEKK